MNERSTPRAKGLGSWGGGGGSGRERDYSEWSGGCSSYEKGVLPYRRRELGLMIDG